MRRLVRDIGVRGFKIYPAMRNFLPNDCETAHTVLEACVDEGVITLFHTNQTYVVSGKRGGMGVWLKYSNPMHLYDVAVDFSDMLIVLAQPFFPWTEEGLAVAQLNPNVFCDMSGWPPRYFAETFSRYASSILK